MPELDSASNGAGRRFEPLEILVDADKWPDAKRDDAPLVVVLEYLDGDASEVEIPTLDCTVAEANTTYPADDRVVRVAFVTTLQHNVVGWQSALVRARGSSQPDFGGFLAFLKQYVGEWRVAVTTYDYPESRLRRVTDDDDIPADVASLV